MLFHFHFCTVVLVLVIIVIVLFVVDIASPATHDSYTSTRKF